MKNITIKSCFTCNRTNNRVFVIRLYQDKILIPRKSIIFAELSDVIKLTEKDLINNVLHKKYLGLIVRYDFDLDLAIINNTTFEDLHIAIDEPIFIIKDKKSSKS